MKPSPVINYHRRTKSATTSRDRLSLITAINSTSRNTSIHGSKRVSPNDKKTVIFPNSSHFKINQASIRRGGKSDKHDNVQFLQQFTEAKKCLQDDKEILSKLETYWERWGTENSLLDCENENDSTIVNNTLNKDFIQAFLESLGHHNDKQIARQRLHKYLRTVFDVKDKNMENEIISLEAQYCQIKRQAEKNFIKAELRDLLICRVVEKSNSTFGSIESSFGLTCKQRGKLKKKIILGLNERNWVISGPVNNTFGEGISLMVDKEDLTDVKLERLFTEKQKKGQETYLD